MLTSLRKPAKLVDIRFLWSFFSGNDVLTGHFAKKARNSLSPANPPQDSKDVPVGLLCQAWGQEQEEEEGQELHFSCYSSSG